MPFHPHSKLKHFQTSDLSSIHNKTHANAVHGLEKRPAFVKPNRSPTVRTRLTKNKREDLRFLLTVFWQIRRYVVLSVCLNIADAYSCRQLFLASLASVTGSRQGISRIMPLASPSEE